MSSELADAVFEAIGQVTEPLFARIKALETELAAVKATPPVPGPPGPQGERGEQGVAGDKGETGAAGERGEQGIQGEKGEQGTQGERGLQGEKGDTGAIGPQGLQGEKGDTGEIGPQGLKGDTGDVGPQGIEGQKGSDGKDGVGVAGALIDREGALTLTLSDGSTKPLGVVVGSKGADGANGRDGVGFEDVDESFEDDGRIFVRKYLKDGAVVREFRHVTKQPIFRDVWRDGVAYKQGDLVQWDGSGFIALTDAPAMKPGTGKPEHTGWKLWIKKGSEGKPGKAGPQGERGKTGEKGDRGPDRW